MAKASELSLRFSPGAKPGKRKGSKRIRPLSGIDIGGFSTYYFYREWKYLLVK